MANRRRGVSRFNPTPTKENPLARTYDYVQLGIVFPADDDPREQLKAVAKAEDRSVCGLVRQMIREGLDRRKSAEV